MSRPQAVAIQVSSAQQALLERLRRRQTADQRLVRRASLILALAAEPCVEAVARRLKLARLTVRLWRDRWLAATPALGRAEQHPATQQQLLGRIAQVPDVARPRPVLARRAVGPRHRGEGGPTHMPSARRTYRARGTTTPARDDPPAAEARGACIAPQHPGPGAHRGVRPDLQRRVV